MMQVEAKFSNQKSFSNTIHERVLKITRDVTESFDKFEIKNAEGEKLFFNEVNHYYHDLANNIYHLRKIVINIGQNNQTARDLQEVAENLNKLAGLTQSSLNLTANELKAIVKNNVVVISAQIERLMKIVEYDDMHEYKQKVLDSQHDLVLCVEKIKLYNQCRYLSIAELTRLLQESVDKIKNNLIIIKTGHELLEEDFSHYICHGMQILQNVMDHMRRNTNLENYAGEFRQSFKNTYDYALKVIEDVLEAVRYNNPMNRMLVVIEDCHKNILLGSSALEQGMKGILASNVGKAEKEMMKHLIPFIFINGLTCVNCINQSIEDAIIKICRDKKVGI